MKSDLSWRLDCHGVWTVMAAELSCRLNCQGVWTVMASERSWRLNCHGVWTVMAPELSWRLNGHDVWTVMTSKLSWHLNWHDVWTVRASEVAWRLNCDNVWMSMPWRLKFFLGSGCIEEEEKESSKPTSLVLTHHNGSEVRNWKLTLYHESMADWGYCIFLLNLILLEFNLKKVNSKMIFDFRFWDCKKKIWK